MVWWFMTLALMIRMYLLPLCNTWDERGTGDLSVLESS